VKRRDLLKGGVAALAGAAAGAGKTGDAAASGGGGGAEKGKHRRWGMAIDIDRCTACGSCTIACRQENNVPPLGAELEHQGAHIEWMSLLWEEPEEPGGMPSAIPFPCQHCADAPCIKACPVGATSKSPDGITLQTWDRCIGCRYCMVACPYGRRSFNWKEPKWEGTQVQMLNPDVATRPKGVVEKCTFCLHRIRRVEEEAALDGRDVTDAEVQRLPACAAACPAAAITFGDLEDPESEVARQSRSPRAFRLLEHLGTKPSVVYLKRDRRSR
jgi:molybdopterin-containing oxidoreductase family iron-sulfur binding subunit